ncbi:MAG: VOC family protein [Gammaproteobacteria bacterium]|nr:VOC family protein [Gammaproteobacteria bacterium]
MDRAITQGVHHVGLTVSKLEESANFFTSLLGWNEVRRREDYPAIFVSDGTIMLTLWATKEEPFAAFDKNRNIGLHHIALTVSDEGSLNQIYKHMQANNVEIEFSPELLGAGPAKHMMCYDPSGIRIEFIWPGNT